MRKNVVKNIIKMVATTAMVIGIAATVKVNANAMTVAEFASLMGMSEAEVRNDSAMMAEYYNGGFSKKSYASEKAWVDGVMGEVDIASAEAASTGTTENTKSGVVVNHKGMLDLINADRKENGRGSLVWSADLEKIAHERVLEVLANFQSSEMAAAIAAGDYNKQCVIGHSGMRKGTSENVSWAGSSVGETDEYANSEFIASAGHHRNRIRTGWTQYACATYIDPTTGEMVWVEIFADNSFKGASSFDYMRYAKDYPDLAAAFGQNKNALYNHYITYGVYEGRKAYYTDGTLIKK